MTQKARYVAGGHITDAPTYTTYSRVVSRDTVRIGLFMAVLNNLDILVGDIQDDFLKDPTEKKIFFYAGDEWRSDKDKVVIISIELYGLKSSALHFRIYFSETLGNRLGY